MQLRFLRGPFQACLTQQELVAEYEAPAALRGLRLDLP